VGKEEPTLGDMKAIEAAPGRYVKEKIS